MTQVTIDRELLERIAVDLNILTSEEGATQKEMDAAINSQGDLRAAPQAAPAQPEPEVQILMKQSERDALSPAAMEKVSKAIAAHRLTDAKAREDYPAAPLFGSAQTPAQGLTDGGWFVWDGCYEKQSYDVWVKGCDVVLGCWPNAGKMSATDGTGRQWLPAEVLAVRVSDFQGRFPKPPTIQKGQQS